MRQNDRQIVIEFKDRIPFELTRMIKKIIVFGSRAREDENPHSDLDVAVLVSEKTPEIQRQLADIAYQVMWDHDFKPVISLKVFLENRFNSLAVRGFSFYRHLQNEGIPV